MAELDELQRLLSLLRARPVVLEDVVGVLDPAISQVANVVRSFGPSISMKGVGGAPDWMQHEMVVWDVGEALRQVGVATLRRDPNVHRLLEVLVEVVQMSELGKGRQALVSLITDLGTDEVITALATTHLSDDEISAELLAALAKRRLRGFSSSAEACLRNSRAHIVRRTARRYLKLNLG